jgi:hypothetical protein
MHASFALVTAHSQPAEAENVMQEHLRSVITGLREVAAAS